jgi:predicted ArsR family transcriptional regulator
MHQTLKITNVLSDPTRFYIYHYITNKHSEVTVSEIASEFNIHPNVARLHLTKLVDVNMLVSDTKKTGQGGRPSRFYRLSEELIQLTFPYRDYYLLSKITMRALMTLGASGTEALYTAGKEFGSTLIQQEITSSSYTEEPLTFQQKLSILQKVSISAGVHATFRVSDDNCSIFFQLCNCPFKECGSEYQEEICHMHISLLKGIFESLFDDVSLIEGDNILKGCQSCTYEALVHTRV